MSLEAVYCTKYLHVDWWNHTITWSSRFHPNRSRTWRSRYAAIFLSPRYRKFFADGSDFHSVETSSQLQYSEIKTTRSKITQSQSVHLKSCNNVNALCAALY